MVAKACDLSQTGEGHRGIKDGGRRSQRGNGKVGGGDRCRWTSGDRLTAMHRVASVDAGIGREGEWRGPRVGGGRSC